MVKVRFNPYSLATPKPSPSVSMLGLFRFWLIIFVISFLLWLVINRLYRHRLAFHWVFLISVVASALVIALFYALSVLTNTPII